MIIPVKKLTLISHEPPEKIVENLGGSGLVHIETAGLVLKNPEIDKELEKLRNARKIIKEKNRNYLFGYAEIKKAIEIVIEMAEKESILKKRLEYLSEEKVFYDLFGQKIKLSDIKEIKKNGAQLYFYVSDNEKLKKEFISYVEKDGKTAGLTFERIAGENEFILPEIEIADILAEINEIESQLAGIDEKYDRIGNCLAELDNYEKGLLKELTVLEKKRAVSPLEGIPVNIISGFINPSAEKEVEMAAVEDGWAYKIETSTEKDNPPVLLKNNSHVENIIYPVYDFMGSWPSPFGRDPSLVFAVSLIVFGSILIGDAGYGLAFLAAAFFTRKKLKLPFLYYIGAGCVIWGSITGTWFGNSWIVINSPLKYLVIPGLSSYNLTDGRLNTDIQGTMGLMFILGGIHLTFAKLMAMGKEAARNIENIGDIGLIWGMVLVVRILMAGEKNTALVVPLLAGGAAIGAAGILLRNESAGSKIISIISKPVSFVNIFADTMSYIRLFAVGFASLIVGMVGSLIAGMTGNILAGAVIFILMNSINLSLGLIAILVHAVRLNNLEFANNSGIELGIKKFVPFKL